MKNITRAAALVVLAFALSGCMPFGKDVRGPGGPSDDGHYQCVMAPCP